MRQQGINLHNLITGVLIVTAGVLLFLFNKGFLPIEYKHIVFSWQMLLIALGFNNLFNPNRSFWGVILMLVGGVFILPKLDIEALSFVKGNSWSILLVITGIIVFIKGIFGKHYFSNKNRMCYNRKFNKQGDSEDACNKQNSYNEKQSNKNETGYIYRNYVFGGSKEKSDIKEFKGGEINCVFGGLELDLTDSQLAEGVNVLSIHSVLGGVVLILPRHWKVEIRQNQVFGNFADKRTKPSFEVDENKILIIEASSVFGGGEIKNGKE